MNHVSTQPDALLQWMACLADETRLRILRLLERHELGVAELCDVLQLPQSTVSRHLKVLGDAPGSWVRSRRQGTTNLYRMILDELDEAPGKLYLVARDETQDWATLHQDEVRLLRRLRERRTDSQAFFAGAAGEWDRLREELYGSSFGRDALAALLPSEWVVADLGCGTGVQTAELARCVRHVYAVDNSDAMLAAARERTSGLTNVEVLDGSLEALPIPDAACDAAMLVLVLTYVEDVVTVLQETRRILRPGGRVVIIDLLRHDREDFRRQMGQVNLGFHAGELDAVLREVGFDSTRAAPLPPEPKARGPVLLVASGNVSA